MSDDKTIFEQIIDGEIPSFTVYEDEKTYAFLDANPLAPGHTLVIPKEPYERLNDMPADEAGEVFGVISELAPAVEAAVGADASTVAVNNGPEAGQEVPHVHWHIIPRFADDGVGPIHRLFEGADIDDEEMERIASDIRNAK
ncbi:MAG: HIT family protein [Natrialbaceae archaeon]